MRRSYLKNGISRRGLISAGAAIGAGYALDRGRAQAAECRDGAVLTIAGAVGKPNRPSFSEKRDGFFKHHGLSFDQAFAFNPQMLAALPQRKVTATTPQIGRAEFQGPGLAEVIEAAGVTGDAKTLRLIALDGYGVDLSVTDAASGGWILATSANGQPFGLGDFAPVWLIRPFEGEGPPPYEEEQKWIWSAFYIQAE